MTRSLLGLSLSFSVVISIPALTSFFFFWPFLISKGGKCCWMAVLGLCWKVGRGGLQHRPL